MYTDIISKKIPRHVARTYGINYPVEPLRGMPVRSFYYAQTGAGANSMSVSVVANLTIFQNNVERDIIIFSPPQNIKTDQTVIRATVGNYGRIKSVVYNADSNEVKSVNKIWLIPWNFVALTTQPNASATIGGLDSQIAVYWSTEGYEQSVFLGTGALLRFQMIGDHYTPLALSVGNLGTNLTLPLRSIWEDIIVTFGFDGTAGNISLVLYACGERIDLLSSLTVPFSASRTTERELSRGISNAVSILASALSVAGGAMSGNPLAIAAGVGGLAQTVATTVTQTRAVQSSVDGQAFINCSFPVYGETEHREYLNCFGIVGHNILNYAEFTEMMQKTGYIGKWFVNNFDLYHHIANSPIAATWEGESFTYTGTFRQFADNDNLEIMGNIPFESKQVIRNVMINGFTLHYVDIEPVLVNWWIHPQPSAE